MTDHIVQDGAPVLRKRTVHVPLADIGKPELGKLIAHMRKLLAYEDSGVGLAAPQVGVPLALFIVAGRVFEDKDEEKDRKKSTKGGAVTQDTALKAPPSDSHEPTPHPKDTVFINPELIRMSRKKEEMSEGCLSVRGKYGSVLRHEKASIRAFDEKGRAVTYHGAGLLAQIFQHEMDHLSGILFVDKAVTLENDLTIKNKKSNIKN